MAFASQIVAIGSTCIRSRFEADGVEACRLKTKSEAASMPCEEIQRKRTQRVVSGWLRGAQPGVAKRNRNR